jgi:hypothetical protein
MHLCITHEVHILVCNSRKYELAVRRFVAAVVSNLDDRLNRLFIDHDLEGDTVE